MHVCIYYDRIEMHRGKLTRIVTANWKEKRLDVYRRDEDGRERVRNLYCCMMGGYGVAFPGEKIHRNLPDIQKLDPWSEPSMDILSLASNRPSLEAQRLIEDRYPAFRYVMEKADLTCDEIIRILPIWKAHPEVELLLSAGYRRIAFSKRFYTLSKGMKKNVVNFLRMNTDRRHDFGISEILTMIRCRISTSDYMGYKEFMVDNGERLSYPEYLYLKGRKKRDIRIYVDYIKMLKQTMHSIEDDYWHYPKNIARAHGKVMREIERTRMMKDAEEMKKKQDEYSRAVKKLLKKRLVTRSGISVYVPEDIADIQKQAKALNQCLITSDYIGKVIQRKCVLVFIRDGKKPMATAELLPNGKIGQFYGNELDFNDCLPPKKAKYALGKWTALYSRSMSA